MQEDEHEQSDVGNSIQLIAPLTATLRRETDLVSGDDQNAAIKLKLCGSYKHPPDRMRRMFGTDRRSIRLLRIPLSRWNPGRLRSRRLLAYSPRRYQPYYPNRPTRQVAQESGAIAVYFVSSRRRYNPPRRR